MAAHVEHDIDAPEADFEPGPARDHPSFGVGKVGLIIVAVLAVLLVAWRVGFTVDSQDLGRDAGGFAGGSDYGGGSSYDYGGSSRYDHDSSRHDYGSSSYDYGSSSYDYGSSSYDRTSSSSSSDYSSSSSSEVSWPEALIGILIFLIIISPGFIPDRFIFGNKKQSSKHRNRSKKSQPAGASRTPDSKLKPLSELESRDPQFSAAAVEEVIANVYVRMQQAWTAGDFEPMRPYFSNSLFSQFSNQLEALTKQGRVNYVDNIAVLETTVRGWYESSNFEYLVMKVRTRITDYTMAGDTLVSGKRDAELFMEYEYTLERPAGTLTTGQTEQTEAGECPNCGATINLAQNAKCEYCGAVVESKRFTWVISAIKGISQQTAQ